MARQIYSALARNNSRTLPHIAYHYLGYHKTKFHDACNNVILGTFVNK